MLTELEKSELVDIRTVHVDQDLPKKERIREYVRQIRNPYRFKCGDFIVTASFATDGVTIEERLRGLIR